MATRQTLPHLVVLFHTWTRFDDPDSPTARLVALADG